VNFLTAALALYRMAALAPGETVLVHNTGGGRRDGPPRSSHD
jgi:NADPH:quinone reductase-like Zn-dependent oxidoreductase